MKAIAGSVIVMSGSLIMACAHENIPRHALPTIFSIGLIFIGLVIVLREKSRDK